MFSPAHAIYNLQFTLLLLIFCLPHWMKVSQDQGFLSGLFTAAPRPQLRARFVLNTYWLNSIFPSGSLSYLP